MPPPDMSRLQSIPIIKPLNPPKHPFRIGKFIQSSKQTEFSPATTIYPPQAGPRERPKAYLKGKSRISKQVKINQGRENLGLKATQWTVEDRENKHAYTGNAEPAHNHASHVLLSYTGTHFTMYPVEFYKFKPIVGYKTLDINEAENLMKSGSLTASTETMKTKKTQILDNIEQKQQEMSAAAAYRQEINVKKEGKRDLTLSDDVAKRRERKRDGIDFEAQFSDDEQEAPLAEEDVVANPHLRDSDDEADDSLTSAGKKINDLLKGDDAEKGSSSSSGGSKKDKKRTSGGKRSSKDKSKSPTPIDNGDSMDDDSDDYDSDDNYDDLDFSDDDDGDSEEDTNSSNIINNNNNIHTSSSSSSSGTPPSGMAPGQKQGSVGVSSSGSGSRKKRSRDGTGPAAPGKKKAKTSLPPTVTEGEIRAEFAKHNNTMTSKQLVENLKRNRDHLDSQNLLGVLRSICSMEVDKTGQRILILKK